MGACSGLAQTCSCLMLRHPALPRGPSCPSKGDENGSVGAPSGGGWLPQGSPLVPVVLTGPCVPSWETLESFKDRVRDL